MMTTFAHELALLVVFQSSLHHIVDAARNLDRQPYFIKDYLADLPVIWDETRFISGEVGKLSVLARRAGETWYLAGINGLKETQRVGVSLTFLGPGRFNLFLIEDGSTPTEFAHSERIIAGGESLHITLASRGGFSARLKKTEVLVGSFSPASNEMRA